MLEKLIMVVNQARIIFNCLQPQRQAVGIKKAARDIIMHLVTPYLDAKKRKMKKRNYASTRKTWTATKTTWQPEMAVNLQHLPLRKKMKGIDSRLMCRQCLRNGSAKPTKSAWHCGDCQKINNDRAVHLCYPECWEEWHSARPGGHNLRRRTI